MPLNDPYAETQIDGHTLTVYSNPQLGAEVRLDGQLRGRTPTIMRGVPAGRHILQLRLDGYEALVHELNLTGPQFLDLPMEPLGASRPPGRRSGVPFSMLLLAGAAAILLIALVGLGIYLLLPRGETTTTGFVAAATVPAPVATAVPTPVPTAGPSTPAPATSSATPLPQATATVRPTQLQSATLAKSVDTAGNPVEPGAIFGPDDRVYFSMGSGTLSSGTRIRVTIVTDRVAGAPSNLELGRVELQVQPNRRLSGGMLPPPDGWPLGRYRVDLFVEDTLDQSLDFQVR